jgi:hypothetical protein
VNKTISETFRKHLQCWGCKGTHLYQNFPLNKNTNQTVHNIHEATKVNDIARSIHKINVFLENQQVDHQSSMVEIECMLNHKLVSILIDLGAILIYISPMVIENYKMEKSKHKKY